MNKGIEALIEGVAKGTVELQVGASVLLGNVEENEEKLAERWIHQMRLFPHPGQGMAAKAGVPPEDVYQSGEGMEEHPDVFTARNTLKRHGFKHSPTLSKKLGPKEGHEVWHKSTQEYWKDLPTGKGVQVVVLDAKKAKLGSGKNKMFMLGWRHGYNGGYEEHLPTSTQGTGHNELATHLQKFTLNHLDANSPSYTSRRVKGRDKTTMSHLGYAMQRVFGPTDKLEAIDYRTMHYPPVKAPSCQNSSSKILSGGCYGKAATHKVRIEYHPHQDIGGSHDILSLCPDCASSIKRDAEGHGYKVKIGKI